MNKTATRVLRALMVGVAAVILSSSVLGTPSTPASPAAAATLPKICGNPGTPAAGQIKHVIWIWLENEADKGVLGNTTGAPYQNKLADQCGVPTHINNESHGSLGNYIAASSGESILNTEFVKDCLPNPAANYCVSPNASIYSQLDSTGKSWRSYSEDIPSNCYRGNKAPYAARHNPAVYFSNLSTCSKYSISMGDSKTHTGPFYTALANGNLPTFASITPNLINDGHDGASAVGVKNADTWLAGVIPLITAAPNYQSGDTVVFVTYDEGIGNDYVLNEDCTDRSKETTRPSCHIPTIVVAPNVPTKLRDSTFYTHYSLLRTTEEILGLPKLGLAAGASSMLASFKLGPVASPTNLLPNPGFETTTGGAQTGWANYGGSTTLTSSTTARTGTRSVKVSTSAAGYSAAGLIDGATPTVNNTVAGTTYTASCWVRPSQAATLSAQLSERKQNYTKVGAPVVTAKSVTNTTGWTQVQVSAKATASGNMMPFFLFTTETSSGGLTFLVDDCSLTAS